MTAADFLSKYDIDYIHSLDQKGLGSVYTAKEKESGEQFAVKIIELHPFFDKGDTFERYETAKSLKHKNLLEYFEVLRFPSEDTIQHFILMPIVEKGTLKDRLEELTFDEKIEILKQVLYGLLLLHKNEIIWQYLRSDHILLQKENDHYIPKFINYGAKNVLPKQLFSNFEYLAPEQVDESDNYYGTATDIWAFGVLAFEMFSGQLPFGRKTAQTPNRKIKERIQNEEIAELFENIPETYKIIIKRCLKKEISERWKNVEEIINYLDENSVIKPKSAKTETSILATLEKMGEDHEEDVTDKNKLTLLERKFLRKPSNPIQWWEPVLWLGLATLVGYLLSKL